MNSGITIVCDGDGCTACSDQYSELRGTRAYDYDRLVAKLGVLGWTLLVSKGMEFSLKANKNFCPSCAVKL